MQATVAHFCNAMMFFPWVLFIQIHMVINIYLDLLIGTWIQTKKFIMKRNVWLFMDKNFIC